MKKLLLPIIISSVLISSVSNAATEEQIKDVINKNQSVLFSNQASKDWGDTPTFVKMLTTRINVKNKSEGLSPFNILWLEKVIATPKTYGLSQEDQDWINRQIKEAKDNKSIYWLPSGLSVENVKPVDITPTKTVEQQTSVSVPVVSKSSSIDKSISADVSVSKKSPESTNNPTSESKPAETKSSSVETPKSSSVETEKPIPVPESTPVKIVETKKPEPIIEKSIPLDIDKKVSVPEIKPVSQKKKEVSDDIKLPLEKATLIRNKKELQELREHRNQEIENQNLNIDKELMVNKKTNTMPPLIGSEVDKNSTNGMFYLFVSIKLFILSLITTFIFSIFTRKNKKTNIKELK